ncbi:DinB family protein [Ureibacillus endophyticus]|uniref:DinB family protein n=1 Tax=Ureibacillus endophyticus TaxID=1978490 RepID=A0A494Z2V9_9BACL|nr:DinB family protein [Lysinibacillus endophyticus]RKQ16766.1 DinB family protein [Lysinibacillus endophyticus]
MQINELARDELLKEVESLSDEVLNQKPSTDQWSIKQILEHLFLMEIAIANIIKEQLENGEVQTAKPKPIEATVNRKYKVSAPEFSVPTNDFATLEELKEKLAMSRQELKTVVEKADQIDLENKAYPHPAFGLISLSQWIPFVGYHERRHILQIKEVKESFGI